jgi:hypothetical protein
MTTYALRGAIGGAVLTALPLLDAVLNPGNAGMAHVATSMFGFVLLALSAAANTRA